MTDNSMSDGPGPRLHLARAKYLTAYVLLSHATAQLDKLAVTRGAYKRTRRSIVRAAAIVMLVGGMLGLAMPRTGHATPVFAVPNGHGNPYPAADGGESYSPALADIDGDGDLDMFVGSFMHEDGSYKYQNIAFFENTGTASLPAFAGADYLPFGAIGTFVASDLAGDDFHGGPNLVDIDDDGDLDLFLQNATAGVDFFENTGTANAPAFTPAAVPTGFKDNGYGVADAFVDIDGDGDIDAFHGIADPTPYVTFQENTGTAAAPSFAAEVADPYGLVAGDLHPTPVFVDTDGDGDFDAFMGQYDGGLRFQENTGTPLAASFGPSSVAPFGFSPYGVTFTTKPAFGDIDDDGDVDMFTGVRQSVVDDTLIFYENLEINCGDNILDPSEACDGTWLSGDTCEGIGYEGGTLACLPDCSALDTSACTGQRCPPTPSGGCLAPGKAQLQLKANADPAKSSLKFKWQKGAAFDQLALGNPATTADTALCIYDEIGGNPGLVGRIGVEANAFWVTKDPKGYQLVDKTGTYDGVTKVQLKTGAAGKTSASLQAKGLNLSLPPPAGMTAYFTQDTDVTVQLVSAAGICWSADFAVAGTTKNDGVQFKAKTP